MYYRANNIQRFCTFLIDLEIISLLTSLIVSGIYQLINYDSNIISELYSSLLTAVTSDASDETILQLMVEIIQRYLLQMAIQLPIYIVIDILYLIVLPYFWKKQTLGRWFMGCKVISKNGDLTIGKLFLRELVGTFIFYQLLGSLGILVTIILVFTSDKSLVDIISKTALVNARVVVVENNTDNNFNQFNNNNYNNNDYNNNDYNDNSNRNYNPDDVIDAKVEDVDDSSDDDEYKVI